MGPYLAPNPSLETSDPSASMALSYTVAQIHTTYFILLTQEISAPGTLKQSQESQIGTGYIILHLSVNDVSINEVCTSLNEVDRLAEDCPASG